jgi:hypothetical protein
VPRRGSISRTRWPLALRDADPVPAMNDDVVHVSVEPRVAGSALVLTRPTVCRFATYKRRNETQRGPSSEHLSGDQWHCPSGRPYWPTGVASVEGGRPRRDAQRAIIQKNVVLMYNTTLLFQESLSIHVYAQKKTQLNKRCGPAHTESDRSGRAGASRSEQLHTGA